MILEHVRVSADDLVWLADELIGLRFNDIAAKLLQADSREDAVALTLKDCEALLTVLDDAPQRLARLHDSLGSTASSAGSV